MIEIIVTYVSGRKERHFVKPTKTQANKALQKKIKAFNAMPTIIHIETIYPKKERL